MGLYFEVQRKKGSRSDRMDSCNPPASLPGFVLCHNYDWDDNNYHNWYCLHYYDAEGDWHKVGELHLMHKEEESAQKLKENFRALNEDFCSLGNDTDYYEGIYRCLGSELAEQVLAALQDCAVNVKIYDRFKDNEIFRLSLRREQIETEKAIRLARFIINGRNLDDAFSFVYHFRPPYNDKCISDWNVKFPNTGHAFQHTAGVIGVNGVGKTQMLCSFIKDLLDNNHENFTGSLPVFSTIIAICSTPFDSFMEIDSESFMMPYIKCCLEQNKEETEKNVFAGATNIKNRGTFQTVPLMREYVYKLKEELPTENIDEVFPYHDSGIGVLRRYDIDKEKLHKLIGRLSSGQLHTLMLLTRVYENIYYDTLFVIDEPEVHLHPNAILSFSKLLDDLLDEFHCYAIVTTHSPLVVREMIGRNVFVVKRHEDNNAYIGHVEHETFGEDIAILYRDIFGYDDKTSCFVELVNGLVKKFHNFDSIIEKIGIENLSMASRFTIRNLVAEYTKKKGDKENEE